MKKVGIITVSRTNNFGAELQAYALQKKLQLLGYNAEIIDYLYYKHKNYRQTSESRPMFEFGVKDHVKKYFLYRVITPLLENYISIFHSAIRNRIKNFDLFHKEYVRFSKQYRSLKDLRQAEHTYDVYVVGSDQVWNPATATSLSPYFLEFAPKDKLKMSYASSFGVSKIDPRYHQLYQKYLSNLNSIAVREEDGVALVMQITGKNAERVLDPTLLLSKAEWAGVVDKKQNLPDKFLLIYMLHESAALMSWAYHISDRYGVKMIMICKRAFANKKYKEVVEIADAGPSQFIELFNRAFFVVTNSFHGTAFSVNFNIPFLTVLKKGKANNSRMQNFLALTELTSHLVYDDVVPHDFEEQSFFHDFSNANELLNGEIDKSIKYLTDNIK